MERPLRRRLAVRLLLRCLLTTAALLAAYYLLPMDRPFAGGTAVALVLGLVVVALLIAREVRAIMRDRYPRLRAVEALATAVPLFLLLFASSYYLLEGGAPGSFTEPMTRTDALYFTVTTFSTVGYGDIAASSQTARVLVMVQIAGDVLLIGVAARLILGAVQAGLRRQEHAARDREGR